MAMVDKRGWLVPADGSHSFYGKARVLPRNGGGYALVSYSTVVAVWCDGKLHRTWAGWSATTSRHVKSFCLHLGIPYPNKAEWLAMGYESQYHLTP